MDRSVVFLDLKGGCAPCDKPLMLRPILFCPVLTLSLIHISLFVPGILYQTGGGTVCGFGAKWYTNFLCVFHKN